MYLDHWQLQRKPFENSPDSTFFYYSKSHRAALDKMLYAAREKKSLALLTGEYGCGKTMLVWAAAKALGGEKFRVGIINNPRLSEVELLNEIIYQLGEDRQTDKMLDLSRMVGDLLRNCPKMRAVATRSSPERTGLDAKAAVVLSMDNVHLADTRYVTTSPAPAVGDPMHYDAFIQAICNAYSDRFYD